MYIIVIIVCTPSSCKSLLMLHEMPQGSARPTWGPATGSKSANTDCLLLYLISVPFSCWPGLVLEVMLLICYMIIQWEYIPDLYNIQIYEKGKRKCNRVPSSNFWEAARHYMVLTTTNSIQLSTIAQLIEPCVFTPNVTLLATVQTMQPNCLARGGCLSGWACHSATHGGKVSKQNRATGTQGTDRYSVRTQRGLHPINIEKVAL